MSRSTNEKVAVHAMRAGFTLMEIMVAVAIIGIMSTMAVVGVNRMMETAKRDAARSGVQNIVQAATAYNIEHRRWPTDIKQLVEAKGNDEQPYITGGEGALNDPWGMQFKMERKGKRIVVMSAGPDGLWDTDDDIRSDKANSSKD